MFTPIFESLVFIFLGFFKTRTPKIPPHLKFALYFANNSKHPSPMPWDPPDIKTFLFLKLNNNLFWSPNYEIIALDH